MYICLLLGQLSTLWTGAGFERCYLLFHSIKLFTQSLKLLLQVRELLLHAVALCNLSVWPVDATLGKLCLEGNHLAVKRLRNWMTVDAGNRLTWNDDVDVNPEADDNCYDKHNDADSGNPGSTTLNLYFLVM